METGQANGGHHTGRSGGKMGRWAGTGVEWVVGGSRVMFGREV